MYAKYLILVLAGDIEQAIRFPSSRSHAEVARRYSGTQIVAAGFCYGDEWVGGQSETLKIASRGARDLQLIRRMLHGPERETWDLVGRIEQERPEVQPIEIPFP